MEQARGYPAEQANGAPDEFLARAIAEVAASRNEDLAARVAETELENRLIFLDSHWKGSAKEALERAEQLRQEATRLK